MARISLLPLADDLDGSELIPVVVDGVTHRAPVTPLVGAAAKPFIDRAENAAGAAEAFTGATYTSVPAGLADTNDGQAFAVVNAGMVTIYRNTLGAAVYQRDAFTSELFADADRATSLINHRRRGMTAAEARALAQKLDDRFDYRDMLGADLTGTHGQSSVLEKFFQKSSDENEVANLPAGRLVVDAPTPVAGGSQIWGSGGRPYKLALDGRGPASGTIFCIDGAGSLDLGDPNLLDSGIYVRGVSTYRNQPPSAPGWEPNDYGPDWNIHNVDVTFDEVCGINPTRWLRLRDGHAGRVTIGRCRAQPFIYGALVEESYDLFQADYLQFWPVWDASDQVTAFMRANCDAAWMFKQDGLMINVLFSIYCRSTLRYSQNAAGKSVSGSVNHLYADGHGFAGLWFDTSVSAAQLAVNIYNSQAYDGSPSFSVLNEGSYNQLHIGSHHCQRVGRQAVACVGTANNIRITDPNVTNFNQANDGSPAYFASQGNRIDLTNDPVVGGNNNGGPLFGGAGDIRAPGRWVDWPALVTSQGGDFASITAQKHEYNLRGNLFEQRGDFTIPNIGSAANLLIIAMPFPAIRAASVLVTVKRSGGATLSCTGWVEAGSTLILVGLAGGSPFQNGDRYNYSARIMVA